MTNTKPKSNEAGTPTDAVKVEEYIDENGSPRLEVESPKHTAKFVIQKTNDGFAFFEIRTTVGKLPKQLEGKYTTLPNALKRLKEYIRTAKMNTAKKYERNHAPTVRTGTD